MKKLAMISNEIDHDSTDDKVDKILQHKDFSKCWKIKHTESCLSPPICIYEDSQMPNSSKTNGGQVKCNLEYVIAT